jgi:hypothetical protein
MQKRKNREHLCPEQKNDFFSGLRICGKAAIFVPCSRSRRPHFGCFFWDYLQTILDNHERELSKTFYFYP